jgi:eukaryotic-like serine/threonine-protein kinase
VNVAVAKLRTALGDSADNPRFIETVPRRGYRFVAPVHTDPAGENVASAEVASQTAAPSIQFPVPKRHQGLVLAAVIAVALIAIIVVAIIFNGFTKSAYAFHRISFGKGAIRSARFGSDKHSIVYGAAWNGQPTQLFWAEAESPQARSYSLPDADILAVSSQGEMAMLLRRRAGVEWISRGTLATMPIAGGAPHEILENVQNADWDHDGKNLAVVHWTRKRCNIEFPIGTVLYGVTGGRWLSDVRVSPDNNFVAFLEHPVEGDDAGVVERIDLLGNKGAVSRFWFSVREAAPLSRQRTPRQVMQPSDSR